MRILITAGPTREPIDAVRFISNRSSGRVGIALARAAAEAGDEVVLLLGPVPVMENMNTICRIERFNTAAELEHLLNEHFEWCQVLIMAAAVADYRSVHIDNGKISREQTSNSPLTLRLEPTPDLVASVTARKRSDQRVIAFALEQPELLEARAAQKLHRKAVDAIVANPLQTMDSKYIQSLWLTAHGLRIDPGRLTKEQFAKWLLDRLKELP